LFVNLFSSLSSSETLSLFHQSCCSPPQAVARLKRGSILGEIYCGRGNLVLRDDIPSKEILQGSCDVFVSIVVDEGILLARLHIISTAWTPAAEESARTRSAMVPRLENDESAL
jgi:hypothetical protein